MRAIDVSSMEWEQVYPGVHRRVTTSQHMTLTLYRFEPGATYPLHHHAQEQLAFVVCGAVTFHNAGTRVICRTNHLVIIPPNEPHAATADSTGAQVISVVSPPRAQDAVP